MVLWLLPTFLWTGQKLDENDRPLQALETFPLNFMNNRRKYSLSRTSLHFDHIVTKHGQKYNKSSNHLTRKAGETENRFVKLYNALLCPQCIARVFTFQGLVVS